jgi:23S rRNA pseudouridine1911/1915/1917 synthase
MIKIAVNEEQAGVRLDKLLLQAVPALGRAGAKRLFEGGKVRVHDAGAERGRRVSKGDVAKAGDVVSIDVAPEAQSQAAMPDPTLPLMVVFETDKVLIFDKPAGQPSAPLEPGEVGTLANALVARYPECAGIGFSPREPGLCHRLDTETSGLVMAARTKEAFDVLTKAIKEERIDKRYLLVCAAEDLPESGTIEIPLAPHPKDRRRVLPCMHPRDVIRNAPRPAHTTYVKLSEHGGYALVEARAGKAMRHQIRAHFAALGHPLIGDTLYGGQAVDRLSRHALHASLISWGGDAVVPAFTVRSPLPPDIGAIVGQVES